MPQHLAPSGPRAGSTVPRRGRAVGTAQLSFAVLTATALVTAMVTAVGPDPSAAPVSPAGPGGAAEAAGGPARTHLVTAATSARRAVPLLAARRPGQGPAVTATATGLPSTSTPTQQALATRTANRPPTFTPVTGTDLVLTSTPTLTWAPDGSRYAWASGTAVTSSTARGTSLAPVASGVQVSDLAWSRSGGRIALVARPSTARGGVAGLWIGTPLNQPLTPVPLHAVVAARNPISSAGWVDGVRLVVGYRPDDGAPRIGIVTLGGRNRLAPLRLTGAAAPATSDQLLDPAPSPDGAKVAYRRVTTRGRTVTHELWVVPTSGGAGLRLLAGSGTGNALGRPVWSSDGTTLHVLRGTTAGARTLLALPVAGGAATPVSTRVAAGSVLHRRPVTAGVVVPDRLAGAREASRYVWPDAGRSCAAGGATSAVLSTGGPWQAVLAAPLAVEKCGPLLPVDAARPAKEDLEELARVLPPRSTVYLVGPGGAVTQQVTALGYRVVHLNGRTLHDTAVAVAVRGFGAPRSVVLVPLQQNAGTGRGYAEGVVAGATGLPVLFTEAGRLPAATAGYLSKYSAGAWAIGASASRAAPWATPLTGATLADTAVVVARNFWLPTWNVVVVGAWPVSSVVAGAAAGSLGVPVLLRQGITVPASVRSYLSQSSASADRVTAFGSAAQLPQAYLAELAALAAGRIRYPGSSEPPKQPDTTPPSPTVSPSATATPSASASPSVSTTPTPDVSPTPTPTSVAPSPTTTQPSPSPTTTPGNGASPTPAG